MISVKEIHSYLQNHTINDACKHFNCSFKELFDYADNRYIYLVGKSFQLKKSVNGKQRYFGTFKTLEEAIKACDELIKNNWRMLE